MSRKLLSKCLIAVLSGVTLSSCFISPAEALGTCKNTELEIVNRGPYAITIPEDGHRVRNKGSIEGWNKMSLTKKILRSQRTWSETLKLSIRCVKDAQFEIRYTDKRGSHVKLFQNINIKDKHATLILD